MLLTIADSVSSVAQFVTVLLLFLFVLVITYITTRYIAGFQKSRLQTGNMELIETLRISNTKYLQIVRAGKQYLVMAVCKDTVTLLATLSEEELVLTRQDEIEAPDFKKMLSKAGQFYSKKNNQDKDEGK